jgi:hypothetical protein
LTEVAQSLIEGLVSSSTRTLACLSRVCCDLVDSGAGVEASPRSNDEKFMALGSGTPPGSALDISPPLVVSHIAASAGSALLADTCLDVTNVLTGLRWYVAYTNPKCWVRATILVSLLP